MNRTIAHLSVLLVAGASVTAACGGKVVLDLGASSASGGATAGAASGGGGSAGGGGCDPASHTIDPTDYDASCTVASDCHTVFIGDFCAGCACPSSAINVADLMKYEAEVQIKAAGAPPGGCFCPANEAICAQGQCGIQIP